MNSRHAMVAVICLPPVLKPKANDTMIGTVVSSGSHNSMHGRMSAPGHQQTGSTRAFLVCFFRGKRTLTGSRSGRALVHASFDHLVGAQQDRRRYRKSERLG